MFDEVYYTHDAWSLFHYGVELNTTNNGPGYVVHPPLGKWMIALGEWIVEKQRGVSRRSVQEPCDLEPLHKGDLVACSSRELLDAHEPARLRRVESDC